MPTITLFLEYGSAIASSTYCLTFFFSDHSIAQVIPNCGLCFEGFFFFFKTLRNILFQIAECGFAGALSQWTHSDGLFFPSGAN